METQDVMRLRRDIARGLGASEVALGLAGEVVDVVERMHGTISRAPLPWQRDARDRAFGISGLVYRLIRGSFSQLETAFGQASSSLHQDLHSEGETWPMTVAALNGVFGDRLARQDSSLALSMQLLGEVGQKPHQVIFLHGLCMSEHGWQRGAHTEFRDWLEREHTADVAYLRYNTGRHISDNGTDLAELLERQCARTDKLSLIGHSMGGLLIRSALHTAAQRGHLWPQRLHQVACLGSPHHGAPLERLGNRANGLLKISPYLKPFSRLGDLRSAGIRDLRFGNLTTEDWVLVGEPDHVHDTRQPLPLPAGPRYLLLAASLSEDAPPAAHQGRHDALVPVASALGLSRQPARQLDANDLQRHVLPAMNHMQLLHDPRVYRHLRSWFI